MSPTSRKRRSSRGGRTRPDHTDRPSSPPDLPTGLAAILSGAVVLAAFVANTGPIANNDYGFHLRFGQEIVASHRPPTLDHHSFTAPGAPYPDHEWLVQAALYLVHRQVGNGGMVVLKGTLIALTLTLLALTLRDSPTLSLAMMAAALGLGINHSQMRPHLLSWVLAAILIWLLKQRIHAALPILLLLWANIHGSVLLGVGIAGLHLLEEFQRTRDRRLLAWAAGCALVPLANPYGLHVYTLFFEISGHTDFIGEWKPYGSDTLPFWILVVLLAVALGGLLRSGRHLPFDVVRIAVLGWLAFSSSRNGIMAAILLAPQIQRSLGPAVRDWSRRTRIAAVTVLAVVPWLVAGQQIRQGTALRFELDHLQLPIESVEFATDHLLTGPIFNDYNFGGYLLWKAWPDLPVFIDGRTEVYKGAALESYLTVSRAEPGWRDIVERYGITFFLVRPERAIAQTLLKEPGWELVYFDYNSVIYVRADLFPPLRRLEIVSPWGHRDRSRAGQALSEITYLLQENPRFFGGHKIQAFLYARLGQDQLARQALQRYLELHPSGSQQPDTQNLMGTLKERGAW